MLFYLFTIDTLLVVTIVLIWNGSKKYIILVLDIYSGSLLSHGDQMYKFVYLHTWLEKDVCFMIHDLQIGARLRPNIWWAFYDLIKDFQR